MKKAVIYALVLFVLVMFAHYAAAQERGYTVGVSVGQTYIPKTFEHARFAFPDLAQGGPGCCGLENSADEKMPSVRLTVAKQFGAFGLEGGVAYLGKAHVWFDVYGPFGGSVQGPVSGRCVESGDFSVSSLSAAGTYTKHFGSASVSGKLGVSGNWMHVQTQSYCQLQTAVHVSQNYTKFSMSPLVGFGAKKDIGGNVSLSLDIEIRRMLFSDNAEANEYKQGNPIVPTVWFGIQKRF